MKKSTECIMLAVGILLGSALSIACFIVVFREYFWGAPNWNRACFYAVMMWGFTHSTS